MPQRARVKAGFLGGWVHITLEAGEKKEDAQ